MKKCVVVIPIYKRELSEDEAGCVRQYVKVLAQEPIVFVCPENLDTAYYEKMFPTVKYERFADKFFTGTKSYNHLMLDTKFYDRFEDYDYMLIAQTDAVIWSEENKLNDFMEMGFDYMGAPWIPERRIWEWRWIKKEGEKKAAFRCCKKPGYGISMGNGGFCLRNISACKKLIQEFSWRKCYWFIKRNEDIFFGVFGEYNKCGFKLADVESGLKFAREYDLKENVEKGNIPYGVHGWQKEFSSYKEMKEFMKKYGIELA